MKTLQFVKSCEDDLNNDTTKLQICVNECAFTYRDDTFVALWSSLDITKCLKLPPITVSCKGPDNIKIRTNTTINDLVGATVWVLRRYNKVYDLYACQNLTFST